MRYREPHAASTRARPNEIVHYWPIVGWSGGAVLLAAVGGACAMAVLGIRVLRSSQLDCTRGGAHECVVVRHYGPFATREAVPLASVRGVELRAHSGKGGTRYSVAFRLDDRTVDLTEPMMHARAQLTHQVVADFVEGRAASPTTIPLDESSAIGAVPIAIGLGAFAFAFNLLRSARLEFDFERGRIAYTRRRFPLKPVRRTFDARETLRAAVAVTTNSKGQAVYSLGLVLRDQDDFPLVANGLDHEKRSKLTAARINELLRELHELFPRGV